MSIKTDTCCRFFIAFVSMLKYCNNLYDEITKDLLTKIIKDILFMQQHDSSPLSDYVEYPADEMLTRSEDFYNEVKRRHSVRSFSDRAVDKKVIENCLKAAGTAPSGANHQPWHFVAVNSADIKKQIREQAEFHERGFYEGRAGEEWLGAFKRVRH